MDKMEEISIGTRTRTSSLNWETCPEEVIWTLLKYLSLKCLVSCMTLNRRWKIIVLDFIESRNLWPKIISETMANMGRTYKSKSVLTYKDMLMNSMIWPFISKAKIKLHHVYELRNITRMNVYKENLILMADTQTEANIKYFNIKNMELTRIVGAADVIDYIENDHIVVSFGHRRRLRAYGKTDPNDSSMNENKMHTIDDVLLYRVVDNVCYIITERIVIWAIAWNGHTWDIKARGRYYGNVQDTIRDINEFNGNVYMVTKFGFIVSEDQNMKSFHVERHSNSWIRFPESTIAVLLNKNDVAMSVNNLRRSMRVWQDPESKSIALICKDMTCAIGHGQVVFIGYKDGTVAICLIQNMPLTQGHPDRLFHVQDFDQSIDDPCVLALEVFEDKLSHHLFVATRNKVLQLLITYPSQIRAYYE